MANENLQSEAEKHDANSELDGSQTKDENQETQADEAETILKTEENNEAEVSEEVEQLHKELDSLRASLQQERAEFINYKKRTLQEKSELEGYVAGKILRNVLPTFDAFDMFMASSNKQLENAAIAGEVSKILEGVGLIQKQFFAIFGDMGIEEFNPLNMEFDPNTMEALSMQDSDEVEVEKVVNVFQKGYLLKGKVIRPARVVVAKPKK